MRRTYGEQLVLTSIGALLALAIACTDGDESMTQAHASTGGSASSGVDSSGGSSSPSENSPSGGAGTSSGGTVGTGGLGQATGGSSSDGGSSPVCPLPESFAWTGSPALAEPKSPAGADWASLKDFTVTRKDEKYLVYATVFNEGTPNSGWQGVFLSAPSLLELKDADQVSKPGMVAPHLLYFTPKDIWMLSYQWGFKYATSTTPEDPSSWSATQNLLGNNPTVGDPEGTGPIDQTLICDETHCYIFFAGDNGVIYRGSMPIEDFPGTFSNSEAILRDSKTALFEGVEVYRVRGEEKYLMLVEAAGDPKGVGASPEWGARFFRAFTASSLDGEWTAMPQASTRATPFAGTSNVTFADGKWTDDISHGDLVREDPSEKKEVDICHLQLLFQGRSPGGGDYGSLPYRPGLLTLTHH